MINFIIGDITLPVNPSKLEIARDGTNELTEVIGIGEVVIPHKNKLATTTIESFLPSLGNIFSDGTEPEVYLKTIKDMHASNKPIKFIVTELNEDMLILIQSFGYDRRAGEHEDIYYKLELIEYRPYGAKIINMQTETTATPQSPQRSNENKPNVNRTYTVTSGDCLIAITKRLSGNGNNWRELYEANKEVVGNNPDLIFSGTILKIPESWVSD